MITDANPEQSKSPLSITELITRVEALAREGIYLNDVLIAYIRRVGRARARTSTPLSTPLSFHPAWLDLVPPTAPPSTVTVPLNTINATSSQANPSPAPVENLVAGLEKACTRLHASHHDKATIGSTELISFISPLIVITDWRLHEARARRVIGACATIGSVTGHRRVKRKALTLLTTVVDNGHLAPLCQPVVQTILDISTLADNASIQGACDHAIQNVARSHPIVGMTAIQWAAAALIRSAARQRAPLLRIMKKWQTAASKYLGRAPISASRWQKIINDLTTDDSTKASWGRRWDPPDGRVQWDAQGIPAPEFAPPNDTAAHETHMAWNANGLRSRW